MAIMVAATMASGTPSRDAMAEPLSISSCAPSTIAAAPTTNLTMLTAMVLPLTAGRSVSSATSVPCSRRAAIRLSTIKPAKISRMKTLSPMESWPSRVKANRIRTAASSRQALTPNCLRSIRHVMHTSDRHIISPVLAVTEPTALPTAISALPSSAAKTDTSISGRVVAKLTMVAPMMNLGMPDASAIHPAASTNRSPPLMMHTSPAANRRTIQSGVLPVKFRLITSSSLG